MDKLIYIELVFIFALAIICFKIKIDNENLVRKGKRLILNPTDMVVRDYIGTLKLNFNKDSFKDYGEIKNIFFSVYNSKNVTTYTKRVFYEFLINNGYKFENFVFDEIEENNYEIKSIEEDISNKEFEKILSKLPNTYKVLHRVKFNLYQEQYEIKNLVIGPNGIFIIDNKSKLTEEEVYENSLKIISEQELLEENLERYFYPEHYEIHSIIATTTSEKFSYISKDVYITNYNELYNYLVRYPNKKVNTEKEVENIYQLFKLTELL